MSVSRESAGFVMATSSSDESTTTKEFQLALSLDSASRLSPMRQKCTMCGNPKKVFYCPDCVNHSHFYSPTIDSFIGSQQCLFEKKKLTKLLEEECTPLVREKQKADQLKFQIHVRKERVNNVKLALEAKRKEQIRNKEKLDLLKKKNAQLSKMLPVYDKSVEKLENYNMKRHEEWQLKQAKVLEKHELLKRLVKLRIQQLVEYIFPIERIQPKACPRVNTSLDSDWGSDMVQELEEASQTTYISDRWVYPDSTGDGEVQYAIVAPTLPASGDYSSYNLWAAQNRDNVPSSGTSSLTVEQNRARAYSISAALTYTAQLVNVIGYYLDIRLPYKMVYKDFCTDDMNEQQLARRVARLNANVLHLCFSQNVDLNVLQPTQMLYNILQMVDTETGDLGRYGPMEVDAQMACSLENQLGQDLQTGKDSDSEDGDVFPNEWEAVPHVPHVPEISAGPMNLQSTQTIPQAQASSITGLYNSAANLISMWRGFTGGR